MSRINTHISIPKNISTKDDLDFSFLKEKGIAYIEQLGGSLWTDFNSHDPGITMLEMLSYAITDLGMRIDMPIKNLLTTTDSTKNLNTQFYKASEIFPTKPVTLLDYRKLFIDIDGVKNCWLRPHKKVVYVNCKDDELSYDKEKFSDISSNFKRDFILNGLYDILVDLEEGKSITTIRKLIRKKYHAHRNLCEDLICINEVPQQMISVCANIEVEKTADEELVNAKILLAIANYFSPSLAFYSIQEMLDKGYTPDQIFDGPILKNGFIDIEELKKAALKKEVRLSDIMKIIMNIEGVKLIKDISIGNCNNSEEIENKWNICIDPNKKPVLCSKRSTFNFNKGVLPLNINKAQVEIYELQLKKEIVEAQEKAKENKELAMPKGKYVSSETYTTIQNDFPDTYGIGQNGLSSRATTKRKSQAKQLKAYLLFFDQILASYFQHLGKIKELLSINGEQTQTFFTQAVQDIKGFKTLVNQYPTTNNTKLSEKLFEQFDNNIERKNEILDHLLARFAEKFGEYTFVMKTLYGDAADKIVLTNKEAFLEDYIAISSERGTGFNYYKQTPNKLWNTDNIAGVQKRIARLLGIKNYNRRSVSESFVEIYDLINAANKKVYRWRIKNASNNIILSGTTEYTSASKARKELYFSVLQIIQTNENTVKKAFFDGVTNNTIIDNFYIHQADSGKYSTHIINRNFDSSSIDYIVAKQYKYYTSLEELETAIIDLISFMKYEFTEEGIFLVEHILLRPNVTKNNIPLDTFMPICTDNCENTCTIDPYSYKVSIVLPGYTFRFANSNFRNYMETIIKEELPAHIIAKICWVGERKGAVDNTKNDLLNFENDYKAYLIKKTNLEQKQPENYLKKILISMSNLNTIYPTGSLIDCDDESDELEGKVILGQTTLGTL
ncbi:MAG: hypothetical protein L3J23_06280 [Flavobacteriaceae bacterium]|nr:hypothetical protein [Flavobacteriaceae bacterium]